MCPANCNFLNNFLLHIEIFGGGDLLRCVMLKHFPSICSGKGLHFSLVQFNRNSTSGTIHLVGYDSVYSLFTCLSLLWGIRMLLHATLHRITAQETTHSQHSGDVWSYTILWRGSRCVANDHTNTWSRLRSKILFTCFCCWFNDTDINSLRLYSVKWLDSRSEGIWKLSWPNLRPYPRFL
jgi:hypothetical protein